MATPPKATSQSAQPASYFAAPPPRPARIGGLWRLAVGLAGLVLLAALAVMVVRPESILGGPELRVEASGALAVLPFANATGDTAQAWVAQGLAPMLADVLRDTPDLEVVPPAALRRALAERGLAAGGEQDLSRVREVASALGAGMVLEATLDRGRSGFRLHARLLPSQGEGASSAVFTDETVIGAAEKLAIGIVRGLRPDALAPSFGRSFSGSPFLDRLYGTGRHLLATAGADRAVPFFDNALALQPRFLAARAGLAACARARGELDAAQRLGLEVLQQAQRRGDPQRAALTLADLAEVAALEGRGAEAEELHLQAQAMLSALGDQRGQARVLASRARLALSERKAARAESLWLEVLGLQEAVGDRLGRAATLLELGSLRLGAGDLEGATSLFGDARKVARAIGDTATAMTASADLGEIAARQGAPEKADALWAEVLAYDRQRGDRDRVLVLAGRRAEVAAGRGDLDLAEELYEDVRELAHELEDARAEARACLALAEILLEKGYRYQARPRLACALSHDREIGDPAAIQRLIARFAYEDGNYPTAVQGQRALRTMPGTTWSARDEALLAAYQRALATGARQTLPPVTQAPVTQPGVGVSADPGS